MGGRKRLWPKGDAQGRNVPGSRSMWTSQLFRSGSPPRIAIMCSWRLPTTRCSLCQGWTPRTAGMFVHHQHSRPRMHWGAGPQQATREWPNDAQPLPAISKDLGGIWICRRKYHDWKAPWRLNGPQPCLACIVFCLFVCLFVYVSVICISNPLPKLSTHSWGEFGILFQVAIIVVLGSWEMNHWELIFWCPFRQTGFVTPLPYGGKRLEFCFSSEPELSLLTWSQHWRELLLPWRLRKSRKGGKKYPRTCLRYYQTSYTEL